MKNVPVVFVGGPADGQHKVVDELRPFFKVAVHEPITSYVFETDPGEAISATARQFEYVLEQMPGKVYVYYPVEWNRTDPDPLGTVLRRLTRGYFGRGND